MNVLFDMETGDPDDLITLLMLLNNPDVNLCGITCYQGSPIQIGLIDHVLKLAKQEHIPVGGWNEVEPSSLSPYYTAVIGEWQPKNAVLNPVQVFKQVFENNDNIHVLTGAPLTNLRCVLEQLPDLYIENMVTQGGYIGNLVAPSKKLSKFKNKSEYRTYNLGNDTIAFDTVNYSNNIEKITYVTKDLCHGFLYNIDIHKTIHFQADPVGQLLLSCFAQYTNLGKSKAMHDPLAMLIMLYPDLGQTIPVNMNHRIDERGHEVFYTVEGNNHTYALHDYNSQLAWNKFKEICSYTQPTIRNKMKI